MVVHHNAASARPTIPWPSTRRTALKRNVPNGHLRTSTNGSATRSTNGQLLPWQAEAGEFVTEKIDGYDELVDIGGGGFSRVYRARDLKHDRTVAIKVLDSRGATESERRAFSRELKAMGKIGDHPHAVTVLESGFTGDDRPFLVMPFYKSGTFADSLRRTGPQSVPDVLDLGVKIASALETVHRLGFLHRDVKPENIFVDAFGNHALGDFGISSITDGSATRTNGVALTPAHAAPEMWEDETPTALTDIYSLGSTLYTLLASRPPFTADSHVALLRKVLSDPPPRLSRDDVPFGLWQLLQRMLEKAPAARPSSALDVATELRALQVEHGFAPTVITVQGWAGDPSTDTASAGAAVGEVALGQVAVDEVAPSAAAYDETVVREPIARPRAVETEANTTDQPTPPNAPQHSDAAPFPTRTEPPAAAATEVRSPLQRPARTRTNDAELGATTDSATGSSGLRRVGVIAGVLVLLVAAGALASALTGGVTETDPTDDPADEAVQDLDEDDIGPVLIASDPTDFRLETTAGELFARWDGTTNPNVRYEVMTNGIDETVEVEGTEVNLTEAGLLIDGAPSCVSVRVTTVSPARVGGWVGPECGEP